MTTKKVANKIAKFLRKNYRVNFGDSFKMGKKFAQNFSLNKLDGSILEALAQEAFFNTSFDKVFSRYFLYSVSSQYDSVHGTYNFEYKVSCL